MKKYKLINTMGVLDTIKEKIRKAKVKEAIDILDNLIKREYPTLYNDFIILNYRYSKIQKDEIKGIVKKDTLRSERLNVIFAILAFIDRLINETS